MKITRILSYRVDLPLHEETYKWSGGKSVSVFNSTVVSVETDAGITGYGEVYPLGPFYLPAYAAGARAGIVELGPHLIGEDPTRLARTFFYAASDFCTPWASHLEGGLSRRSTKSARGTMRQVQAIGRCLGSEQHFGEIAARDQSHSVLVR